MESQSKQAYLDAVATPDAHSDVEKNGGSKSNVSSKELVAATSEQSFPEGGVRAWLTVLGGFVLCIPDRTQSS